MITDLKDASRDWSSAFNQDKNRRYVRFAKKEKCDLIDSDLQRKINRKNKLALQAMKLKLLH